MAPPSVLSLQLVFIRLALHALYISLVTLDLGLIPVDLLLLLVIGVFVALQLVADQSTRAKTQGTANGGSGPRTANCGADKTAGCSATEGAYTCSLFSCRELAAGAAG